MIGPIVRDLLLQNQETFLIPAENVANVMYQHPLSHGLLVLSKVSSLKITIFSWTLIVLKRPLQGMLPLQVKPLITISPFTKKTLPLVPFSWIMNR